MISELMGEDEGDSLEVTPVSASKKKKAPKKKAAAKKAPKKKAAAKKKTTKKKATQKKGGRKKKGSGAIDVPGFVERLCKVRGDRSQRSFALDLGVFQQNVNRYEAGQVPHADFLATIANVEGISIDWLLLGKGKPKK